MHSRILLAILSSALGCLPAPGAHAQDLAADRIDRFIAALAGEWKGEASTTPVGPLPYDITFRHVDAETVEGSVNLGVAIHTWRFYREGSSLRLRFLSTFRGNRDPLLLTATTKVDGDVEFRTDRPAFLRVQARSAERNTTIRVLHHERLHVEIRLEKR